MPILMNQFKCSNGHTFEANAKLRTRCPSCGVMTKRSFGVLPEVPKEAPPEEPKSEPKHTIKHPVLIRQGRPRMPHKKVVAAIKEEPKAMSKKATKPKVMPKKATKPKGRTLLNSRVSAGIVKTHTVKARGVMPTIKRHPVKTAIARSIKIHDQKPSFQDEVIRKFGF